MKVRTFIQDKLKQICMKPNKKVLLDLICCIICHEIIPDLELCELAQQLHNSDMKSIFTITK